MKFCPWDGTLLVVDNNNISSLFRFRCPVCPYISKIDVVTPVTVRTTLNSKKVDDVLGGEEAWKNVPETDAVCPNCNHKRAYYMQFQTRSADEPMTVFYKCTACKEQWKE
mmetsp:Transcript_9294/g.11140  ORF Transcript_9294/g.11140 Transcript_9294/m.11140 type:complete len:110 (-) Transcript_9294:962-1291(-)